MKFMNMKRFGSIVMAGALALSMAAPAFASNQTVISGTYTPITLRVTVPTTGAAVINPYGLPYTLGESTISGQQIVTTAPLVIQNKSSVALSVAANVTGTASNGVTLEAAGTTADYSTETDKKLHVVFEAFTADTLTSLNVTDNDAIRPLFAALDSADAVLTGDVTTTPADATGAGLVLREGNDGEVQSGGAAFFRLSGEVAKKATWADTDTFSATVAFTFEPGEYTKPAGGTFTIQREISMNAAGDKTATVSYAPVLPTGVTAKTTIYSSSDTTKMTVTEDAGVYKINAQAAGTADLIVTIEGSDGLTYVDSETITIGS